MFSNTVIALYALALAGAVAAQGTFTVATPASIVQCQPASLSWSGGTAPYFPSIIPGSQPGAAALKDFPSQTGTTLVWTADLAAGTSITIQIRDSTGAVQYSSAISIQTSSDASCVNASVSGTASGGTGATSAAATDTGVATTAPAATSAIASTSAAAASSASSVSRSASVAASSTRSTTSASASASNAASSTTKGALGVAAFAGLVGAALF